MLRAVLKKALTSQYWNRLYRTFMRRMIQNREATMITVHSKAPKDAIHCSRVSTASESETLVLFASFTDLSLQIKSNYSSKRSPTYSMNQKNISI